MSLSNSFLEVIDKTYLITGASSGVGKQVAIILDSLGANLILNGRNEEKLHTTLCSLQHKHKHTIVPADLTQLNFDEFFKNYQQNTCNYIHGIAHCAGEYNFTPLRAYSEEKLISTFKSCTVTMCNLFHSAIKNKQAESLSLVTISSVSAKVAVNGNALYGASKVAAELICKNFAIEFAQKNVRCNYVVAGPMPHDSKMGEYCSNFGLYQNTEKIYPLGIGKTHNAAQAVVFLLSSASSWITGQEIVVDGGYLSKGL